MPRKNRDTEIAARIGENLRKLRITRGLTQAEAGLLINVRAQQFAKYEQAIHCLGLPEIVTFCEKLQIPITDLIDQEIVLAMPPVASTRQAVELCRLFYSLSKRDADTVLALARRFVEKPSPGAPRGPALVTQVTPPAAVG